MRCGAIPEKGSWETLPSDPGTGLTSVLLERRGRVAAFGNVGVDIVGGPDRSPKLALAGREALAFGIGQVRFGCEILCEVDRVGVGMIGHVSAVPEAAADKRPGSRRESDSGENAVSEAVERTSDGRFIIVNGRRWRATDPSIPDPLRRELVAELMSARRSVRSARSDPTALAAARARVQDAKVALGERGAPWWEPPSSEVLQERAVAAILALLRSRGEGGDVGLSEVARIVSSPDWRPVLSLVHAAADRLVSGEQLVLASEAALGGGAPRGREVLRYRFALQTSAG